MALPRVWLALTCACAGLVHVQAQACQGPLDCNAKECADCACTDGKCVCADGWAGAQCQTPFCRNATDCSNHGSCKMTASNISCVCDAGYTGAHCETATCTLKCFHGGQPNANCTACAGCAGAWGGVDCNTYDPTYNVTILQHQMGDLYEQAMEAFNKTLQAYGPLVCETGWECVGWGVDAATGVVKANLLFLTMNRSNPQKIWHGRVAPEEVSFVPRDQPQPAFGVGVGAFPEPSDFAGFRDTLQSKNSGLAGIYSQTPEEVLAEYYAGPQDTAMSAVQAEVVLYDMSLDYTGPVQLDREFAQSVQMLPPNSTTHPELWSTFFAIFGTDIIVSSSSGGVVEQVTKWETPLDKYYDTPSLESYAQMDFCTSTGIPGHSGTPPPLYTQYRSFPSTDYNCYGGDPASCTGKGVTTAWQATLSDNPILASYTTIPISEVLSQSALTNKDPTLKANLESAVTDYLASSKAAWAAAVKCPPTCNSKGTCAAPADACTCTGGCSHFGRMCSVLPKDPDPLCCEPLCTYANVQMTCACGDSCDPRTLQMPLGEVNCAGPTCTSDCHSSGGAKCRCSRTAAGQVVADINNDWGPPQVSGSPVTAVGAASEVKNAFGGVECACTIASYTP